MAPSASLWFPPFRLDLANQSLWRGEQETVLKPKTFALLALLVQHASRLVTKREILYTVWPGITVNEEVVTAHIRELRQLLGDERKTPQYIQTIQGRGYRFLPSITAQPVASRQREARGWRLETSPLSSQAPSLKPLVPSLVGREAELTQFHHWLEKALTGERQIVFVAGEAGIGKTALLEAFLHSLASRVQSLESENQLSAFSSVQTLDPRRQTLDTQLWLAWGQCIDHRGMSEPYLPVLDALGCLSRGPEGDTVVRSLRQYAPTWLVQLPGACTLTERKSLLREHAGVTPRRMLRELTDALNILTLSKPVVLLLEDLHWADAATLDWLAFVAARRAPARLLLIGTYRSDTGPASSHDISSVMQEL